MPIDAFKQRIDAMIDGIHQTPKAKGSQRIYMPGEIEWQKRQESLAKGIPLPDDVRASLRELAEEFEMKVDWLAI